ncbi:MAG TPA: L,D-transpeptidase [Leptolyngbyaceae cyanobacterium]
MIEFQSLRRPLTLFSLTWAFWLYSSPQAWLQSISSPPERLNQIVTKPANTLLPSKPFAKVATKPAPAPRLTRWQKEVKSTAQAVVPPVVEPNRLEIDLSSRTVALYRENVRTRTYPVAIGREGWETPEGQFRVLQMLENPKWINPFTDAVIPGGAPDNPLGAYWIGFWTNGRDWIGFHGTPNPGSVGQAVSHGCVRMHNADVEQIFYQVGVGTQVLVKP